MNVYGLFKDGVMVQSGSARELGKKNWISTEVIYDCEINGKKLNGEYDVKIVGSCPRPKRKMTIKKSVEKHDELDYLLRHLRLYGNVYSKSIPNEKIKSALAKEGIKYDIKSYRNGKKTDYILSVR